MSTSAASLGVVLGVGVLLPVLLVAGLLTLAGGRAGALGRRLRRGDVPVPTLEQVAPLLGAALAVVAAIALALAQEPLDRAQGVAEVVLLILLALAGGGWVVRRSAARPS